MFTKPTNPVAPLPILMYMHDNRKEKSFGHVSMAAKLLDDNKPKIHLKNKSALFQTS